MNKKPIAISIVVALVLFIGALAFKTTNGSDELILYGNIDQRYVDLGFRVFGKLESVNFEEGDRVKAGDLLAVLDNSPYVEMVAEREARVNALKENLSYASLQLEHRAPLVQRKSVSEEDYQQVYYTKKSYESTLKEAEAALENARIQLNDTQLKAPANGMIFTRVREPGTILGAGQPVYSLMLDDKVWVRTYISEPELGRVALGMKAEITTDTPESPIYTGHVGFISPISEFTPKNVETPDLRTNLVYQMRVYIDNPDSGLKQGMPVTVQLIEE